MQGYPDRFWHGGDPLGGQGTDWGGMARNSPSMHHGLIILSTYENQIPTCYDPDVMICVFCIIF